MAVVATYGTIASMVKEGDPRSNIVALDETENSEYLNQDFSYVNLLVALFELSQNASSSDRVISEVSLQVAIDLLTSYANKLVLMNGTAEIETYVRVLLAELTIIHNLYTNRLLTHFSDDDTSTVLTQIEGVLLALAANSNEMEMIRMTAMQDLRSQFPGHALLELLNLPDNDLTVSGVVKTNKMSYGMTDWHN